MSPHQRRGTAAASAYGSHPAAPDSAALLRFHFNEGVPEFTGTTAPRRTRNQPHPHNVPINTATRVDRRRCAEMGG
jgi:hypothetical protein